MRLATLLSKPPTTAKLRSRSSLNNLSPPLSGTFFFFPGIDVDADADVDPTPAPAPVGGGAVLTRLASTSTNANHDGSNQSSMN